MRFHEISFEDMQGFLIGQGFTEIHLDGVNEHVFGKIVKMGFFTFTQRVYTSIGKDNKCREKGSDAIRFQFCWRYKEQIIPVGSTIKCLRVKNWQENMRKAISNMCASIVPVCKRCSSPMVQRENGATNEKFWGCSTFRISGCRGY